MLSGTRQSFADVAVAAEPATGTNVRDGPARSARLISGCRYRNARPGWALRTSIHPYCWRFRRLNDQRRVAPRSGTRIGGGDDTVEEAAFVSSAEDVLA